MERLFAKRAKDVIGFYINEGMVRRADILSWRFLGRPLSGKEVHLGRNRALALIEEAGFAMKHCNCPESLSTIDNSERQILIEGCEARISLIKKNEGNIRRNLNPGGRIPAAFCFPSLRIAWKLRELDKIFKIK